MLQFNKIIFTFIFLALLGEHSNASHNKAGNILYKCISFSTLTYEITLITYTKLSSSDADRPEATISFGDGTIGLVSRSIVDTTLGNNTKMNVYVFQHSYLGLGSYIIAYNDPNRNAGICNMENSDQSTFYLQSLLVIHPFLGPNDSPILLYPPIDNGTVDQLFVHNPGAYDTEGDSIAYKMSVPGQVIGNDTIPVTNYQDPASFNLGKTSSLTLDSQTGNLVWEVPRISCDYNAAFIIEEWRGKFLIGYVVRDLQITIYGHSNKPPVIHPNADSNNTTFIDTCIIAGEQLSFPVSATDSDNDNLTLSALGEPFLLQTFPALFSPVTGNGNVASVFNWQTNCQLVREQPYQILFKAEDNPTGNPSPPNDTLSLSDMETWNIRIVGSAPKNLKADTSDNKVFLSWESYNCSNALGYSIYRRKGVYGISHPICETGVDYSSGYYKIATLDNIDTTTFTDDDNGQGLTDGNIYCYLITANYKSGSGYTESYPSNERCAELALSTDELFEKTMFSIYPNPSDGIFNVENQSGSLGVEKIELSDPFGRILYKEEFKIFYKKQTLQIQLPSVSTGGYILKIYFDGKIYNLPLLIYR